MNKKGQELLYKAIFSLIIIVIIAAALFLFISGKATGRIVAAQIVSKQVAMLVDASQPETEIFLEKSTAGLKILFITISEREEIKIKQRENEITACIGKNCYVYDAFKKAEITEEENFTRIKIK